MPHRFSGGGREYLMQFASPTAKAMGHPTISSWAIERQAGSLRYKFG